MTTRIGSRTIRMRITTRIGSRTRKMRMTTRIESRTRNINSSHFLLCSLILFFIKPALELILHHSLFYINSLFPTVETHRNKKDEWDL